MTNPTSNFGWQMPEPTDLVTNLPADFEVFGQAVDTDFADLLGGTTGQVLKKNTNADLDFVWGADSAGMTNPMTTTGDIIYSSPGSTPVRLGIGSAAQVLTVASGLPSWATPAVSASGLVLIESATFSATTSIITGAVFSATYKNYLFLMVCTTSNDDTSLRFRAGGTTTTTDYVYAQPGAYNTSPYSASSTGQTNGSSFGAVAGGSVGSMSSVFIANPFVTNKTLVSYLTPWTQGTSLMVNKTTSGFLNNSTSYDKIDMTAPGNITGHYAVYGYAI